MRGLLACVLALASSVAVAQPDKIIEIRENVEVAKPTRWANAHYRIHGDIILRDGGTLTVENATVELACTFDRQFKVLWKGGKLVTKNVTIGGTTNHGRGTQTWFNMRRGTWELVDTTVQYSFGIVVNGEGCVFDGLRVKQGPNPDALILEGPGKASLKDSRFNIALSAWADKPGKGELDFPIRRALTETFSSKNIPGAKYQLELTNTTVPMWFLFVREVSFQGPPVELTLRNCPFLLPSIRGTNLRGEMHLPVKVAEQEPPASLRPGGTIKTGNVTWKIAEKPAGIWHWGVYLSGDGTDLTLRGPTHICEFMVDGGKAALVGTPKTFDAFSQATTIEAWNNAQISLRNISVGGSKFRGQIVAHGHGNIDIRNAQILSSVLLMTDDEGTIGVHNAQPETNLESRGQDGSIQIGK